MKVMLTRSEKEQKYSSKLSVRGLKTAGAEYRVASSDSKQKQPSAGFNKVDLDSSLDHLNC